MQRLFFALWPDEAIAAHLHAAAREAHAVCGGRLMRRETLHLTLAFLGAVAPARRRAAEAAADGVAGEAFALELDRLGHWKHNHIVWAGCASVPPALSRLADGLSANLRAAGFRLDERPFAVHATLLRRAECAAAPPLAAPIAWPVKDFALVESQPTPAGSRYVVARRWPLAAG